MRVVGERRGSQRAPFAEGQAVVFVDNKRVRARPIDISTTGMALAVLASVPAGMYLRINFSLRVSGKDRWFDADGIVTRATANSNQERMLGIQFSVVEGHVALQIHEYVERQRESSARQRQAEPFADRYGKGGTDRYLSAVKDPSSSSQSGLRPRLSDPATPGPNAPPGFPGGPSAAPVTGEYGPVGEQVRSEAQVAKTGTDSGTYSRTTPAKSRKGTGETPVLGGAERLEKLYRRALEQLEADDAKKRR